MVDVVLIYVVTWCNKEWLIKSQTFRFYIIIITIIII